MVWVPTWCSLDSEFPLFAIVVRVLTPCQGIDKWQYFGTSKFTVVGYRLLSFMPFLQGFWILEHLFCDYGFHPIFSKSLCSIPFLWIPIQYPYSCSSHFHYIFFGILCSFPLFLHSLFTSFCSWTRSSIPVISGFWVLSTCSWVLSPIHLFTNV